MNSKRNPVLDILYDLHARKLSLPAGILAVLLIAIMVVLPKQPAPVPIANPVPQQSTTAQEVVAKPAANITFFGKNVSLEGGLNVFRSKNPFGALASSKCKTTTTADGSAVECTGKTGEKTSCVAGADSLECGSGGVDDLSGGGGGGVGVGAPVPDTDPGPAPAPDDSGDGEVDGDITYAVNVTYDETVMKNVESGKGVPSDEIPMLLYAGSDDNGEKAQFLIADGLSVQGADVDSDLGLVSLAVDDQIILTEADGTTHSFTLTKITATTK